MLVLRRFVVQHRDRFEEAWREHFVDDAVAVGVTFDGDEVHVRIKDGRTVSAPLASFPRLANATDSDRAAWRLIGSGEGIHWYRVDEDVSIRALLHRS